MGGLFEGVGGNKARLAAICVLALLGLFLAAQSVAAVKSWRYIGAGLNATNTITVSGYGEAFGVPDLATFTFTVSSQKLTVAAAQEDATKKINAITAYLKDAGVAEKDIQTSGYSVYPQYEYSQAVCPAGVVSEAYYCPPSKQTLKGYEVRQTTTVKVRDTAKAGELLTAVGGKGATEVSGLTFTFDDPDKVETEARDKAIADAKDKAEKLADALGVRLVRVASFNESGNYPIYYRSDMAYGMGGAEAAKAPAPEISVGENKVSSNVTITYEIR